MHIWHMYFVMAFIFFKIIFFYCSCEQVFFSLAFMTMSYVAVRMLSSPWCHYLLGFHDFVVVRNAFITTLLLLRFVGSRCGPIPKFVEKCGWKQVSTECRVLVATLKGCHQYEDIHSRSIDRRRTKARDTKKHRLATLH